MEGECGLRGAFALADAAVDAVGLGPVALGGGVRVGATTVTEVGSSGDVADEVDVGAPSFGLDDGRLAHHQISAYAPSASPTAANANFVRSFDAARKPAVVDPIPRRFARGVVGASTSGCTTRSESAGRSPDSSPSGAFRSRRKSFVSFLVALAIARLLLARGDVVSARS